MSYRRLGTCTFVLFGEPESAYARVEVLGKASDPAIPNLSVLMSQTWLLTLESQIGKVSKTVQDLTLETLRGQTLAYFRYGAAPPQQAGTTDMRHLATLEIELCLGRRPFVLAHPRDFDPHMKADGLAGLIMVKSFPAIFAALEDRSELRDDTLYMLMYGLHKWETEGRPGMMTAFTQTWDFSSVSVILEQGKELVQRERATKPHSRAEIDIQSAHSPFVNETLQDHHGTYKDANVRDFLEQQDSVQPTESGWMGLSGAVGGCLTVLSTLSFFPCVAACVLGSLVRFDESGSQTAILPAAVPAGYALAGVTLLTAVLGGTALGVRAFGLKGVSTSQALRATFVGALLPLRYVIGALQSLVGFSICAMLFWPLVSFWWPIGVLIFLSISQGLLLLVIRILGGPGVVEIITSDEH